jgi:hypothetical protein
VLLLALIGAHRVSRVFTIEICLPTAHNAPSKLSSSHAMLVLDIHLNLLFGFIVAWCVFILGGFLLGGCGLGRDRF